MASKRTDGSKRSSRKIGYAVAGLGHIAQTAVLPAFAHAKNSRLVALISDDEEKREKLSASTGATRTPTSNTRSACGGTT